MSSFPFAAAGTRTIRLRRLNLDHPQRVKPTPRANARTAMPGHRAWVARLRRQSLSKLTFFLSSFSHQDRFISGAVPLGVEQHEVAARGAFDPDGKSQMIIVILGEGEIVTVEGRPALEPECGKAPYAERVRRAADGTSPQAELLECL